MKAVLISIQPKWVEKIASGKKTIEVRKTRPKIDTPFKCYIYCTVAKEDRYILERHENGFATRLDGKVIGEFVCDKLYELFPFGMGTGIELFGELISPEQFCTKTCLTEEEICDYIGEKDGYGWHISNLVIYDKPKELSEFKKAGFMTEDQWLYNLYPNTHCHYEAWAKRFEIKRPPESWCYVESLGE